MKAFNTIPALYLALLFTAALSAPLTRAQLQTTVESQPRWESPGAGIIRIEPPATRVAIGTRRAPLGVLHINGEFDASLNKGPAGAIHISQGVHSLLIDSNEILARRIQSGTTELPKKIVGAPLHLNAEGGGVFINAKLSAGKQIAFLTDGAVTIGKSLKIGGGNAKHTTADLSVAGKIVGRELIVTPKGWADDVFNATYPLRSLAELEAYLKQNRRLPGMPSEADITRNGLPVGAFNTQLLRNLEELTLHVIEQNTRFRQEKAALEQRLVELERMLDALAGRQLAGAQ